MERTPGAVPGRTTRPGAAAWPADTGPPADMCWRVLLRRGRCRWGGLAVRRRLPRRVRIGRRWRWRWARGGLVARRLGCRSIRWWRLVRCRRCPARQHDRPRWFRFVRLWRRYLAGSLDDGTAMAAEARLRRTLPTAALTAHLQAPRAALSSEQPAPALTDDLRSLYDPEYGLSIQDTSNVRKLTPGMQHDAGGRLAHRRRTKPGNPKRPYSARGEGGVSGDSGHRGRRGSVWWRAARGGAVLSQQVEGEVADDREVLGGVADPDAAVVFAEGDVEDPVEAILDAPMARGWRR